jgi:MFS family permease
MLLEGLGRLTPAQSGAWLAVLPAAALLCAPIAGRLADRFGARPLTVTGMLLTAAGLYALARVDQAVVGLPLAAGFVLVGVGQGLFAVPNASALLSLVPAARLGLAAGLQGTARNLGLAAGVAATGAMLTGRYHAYSGVPLSLGVETPLDAEALAAAGREAYALFAVVALAAAGLAGSVRAPGRAPAARPD